MGPTRKDLEPTWQWLIEANHPGANLLLRRAELDVPWPRGGETDRRKLLADPSISAALEHQREDGSWGEPAYPDDRVLPTLWVLKTLVDSGLDHDTEQVHSALTYLSRHARAREGYFSDTQDHKGVSPCLVGVAERLFYDAGWDHVAGYQRKWFTRYWPASGDEEAGREIEEWDGDPARCYGCGRDLPCTLGDLRAAGAWGRSEDPAIAAIGGRVADAMLDAGIVPSGGSGGLDVPGPGDAAEHWMSVAFPLDWHLDLVGVLDELAAAGCAGDQRGMAAVADVLARRREDGGFSRGWHVTSGLLRGLGMRHKDHAHPIATARAYIALSKWLP